MDPTGDEATRRRKERLDGVIRRPDGRRRGNERQDCETELDWLTSCEEGDNINIVIVVQWRIQELFVGGAEKSEQVDNHQKKEKKKKVKK